MEFAFGEVNIICTDLTRSLNFYQSYLGFREDYREGDCVHMKCGSQKFLLLPFAKKEIEDEEYCTRATVSFDLYTDNIDAAFAYFKQKGVSFAKLPEKEGDYFFIKDPDGNVIEIVPN